MEKKNQESPSRLRRNFPDFFTFGALLRDYRKGGYPSFPWRTLAGTVFAVLYLILPLDLIPDVIPFFGFIDDAAVFALVVKAFSTDIGRYRKWLAEK